MLTILTGVTGVTIGQIIQYNKFLGRNIWVIDVYRSPIERKMSEYFDKLASFHFNNSEDKLVHYDVNRLIIRFNNIFRHIAPGDHYMNKYQDMSVVPPKSFDFSKEKYLMQLVNGIYFVKLRLKDSGEWGQILEKILKTEIIIVNDYETDSSQLSSLYKRFKREYTIPENYLDEIVKCPFLNYYYSTDEVTAYLDLWRDKQTQTMKEPVGYTESEYIIYKNICIENQWQTNVDANHYLDDGCTCSICTKRRRIVAANLKKGRLPKSKLTHVSIQRILYKNVQVTPTTPRLTNNLMNGVFSK